MKLIPDPVTSEKGKAVPGLSTAARTNDAQAAIAAVPVSVRTNFLRSRKFIGEASAAPSPRPLVASFVRDSSRCRVGARLRGWPRLCGRPRRRPAQADNALKDYPGRA